MDNKKYGLSDEEVVKNRGEHGSNKIEEKEPESFWSMFVDSLQDPMLKILMVVSAIMFFMSFLGYGEIYELIGVVFTVLLVSIITVKTSIASDKAYRRLKAKTEKERCKVYREGEIVEIIVDNVVVNDIIVLQSGDKIPADGYLFKGNIKVDNSALNGETEECRKNGVPLNYVHKEVALTGDTFVDEHSLFRGAVVVDGDGLMLITSVGMNTMMGKMAKEMNEDEVDSPMKVKLTHLANQISKFGYIGSIIIAIAMMFRNVAIVGGIQDYIASGGALIIKDVLEAIMLAVVVVVMAVPEGLPLMISIVLMQNTGKMLDQNVLVKKSIGIETAGSLNILFSDKTGTITRGKLEVVEFLDGNLQNSYKNSEINKLMGLAIGKNTGAMFDKDGNVVGGNATDKALLTFLTKENMEKLKDVQIIKSQGFNSKNKYSASELEDITVYKGSPEKIIGNATKMVDETGKIVDIDKDKINEKIDELANRAMRVLAFGYSNKKLEEDIVNDDLILIGFVGIRDDVRVEAKEAIVEAKKAGIQVIMITGDRKETAVAIAKEAGLLESETDIALTSEELGKMTNEEIKNIIPNLRVISRALPTDKSRMVRLAQELNLVCGMTGDGVNDAPALKRADVGFAMGSGTDVAKEAGDIVIIDDNLKSIVNAVLYGRTIYNNILKFVKYQLTINVGAVIICAVAPFIGVKEPLQITHILWINLIMDTLGALALGAEPALRKYMDEKPKSRTQALVSKEMFIQILTSSAWIAIVSFMFIKSPFFINMFDSTKAHMTAYFSLFVLFGAINGFNVRSEGFNLFENIKENKGFIKIISIILVVQVILTIIGGEMFKCTPFAVSEWLVIIGLALTIIPIDFMRKLIVGTK